MADSDLTAAALGVQLPVPSLEQALAAIDAAAYVALGVAADSHAPAGDRFLATGACRELVLLREQVAEAARAEGREHG